MKQMIVSAFSFEMIKQNDDFLTTKNIVESQTRLMECLDSVRIDNLYKEEKRCLIEKN